MPKTAKEILENGLNNDILSFKKMLDTYSYSMDSSNPDKKKLEELSNALGSIMKTNNVLEIEDSLEKIGDIEGFLKSEKNGKSVYDTLTEKMSGVAKDKFDKLLKSVNGQFGYGMTDDVIKENEATKTQEATEYKIEQAEKEKKAEEKEKKKEEEKDESKEKNKDDDKEEFLRIAKENGWDSEEEQQFLSDLYDAHKIEEDPVRKKKMGDIMNQVSTVNTWNLDKKYGMLGMWTDQIKALFSPGELVNAEDLGNGMTRLTYKLPSTMDRLREKFGKMKEDLMIEGNEIMGRHKEEKTEEEAKKEVNRKPHKEQEKDQTKKSEDLDAAATPWRTRTSYRELAKEEYGENYFDKPGMMTERVKEKNKEKGTPSLGM